LDGAGKEGIDFKAFTVWVNTCGDFADGNIDIVPLFLFRRARRYLDNYE
jgi:hypothetical protein